MISVLIPTYNRPTLLRRAIESVLEQSYCDFVIKISDNGSDDETADLCRELSKIDSRVIYGRNSSDIGALNNFQKLLRSVDTDFYCILSDDDFLLPGFLENCISAFNQDRQIGFVCNPTLVVDLSKNTIARRNLDWETGIHEPSMLIVRKMFTSHFTWTGVVFRSELIKKLGYSVCSGDDRLFMMVAASTCKFFVSADNPRACFIVHPSSYSASGGIGINSTRESLYLSLIADAAMVERITSEDLRAEVGLLILAGYASHLRTSLLAQGLNGSETTILESSIVFDSLMVKILNLVPRWFVNKLRTFRNSFRRSRFTIKTTKVTRIPDSALGYLMGDVVKREPFLKFMNLWILANGRNAQGTNQKNNLQH